ITRDEFIFDQTARALALRSAIIADENAPLALQTLAADEGQWVNGWLAALEAAGLLRPVDEAPPIRERIEVLSLNATLAGGILLGKGGETYRTQADLVSFFSQVQAWYGDTARHAGDPEARKAAIEYIEVRYTEKGAYVLSPVPAKADPAAHGVGEGGRTHFLNFDIFVGGRSELEYLRHIGVLDEDFQPVPGQPLDLARYLVQMGASEATEAVQVRGPQALPGADGNSYVPAATALPYTVAFSNPSVTPAGEVRIVTQLDAALDPRSVRLGDIKVGDLNVRIPGERANFQGDFDF
ncbi:MAG TPA: hypothetical protein DCY18_00815, partial [Thauera sp.]|nr:hypothetical protein [Thauera sp.]